MALLRLFTIAALLQISLIAHADEVDDFAYTHVDIQGCKFGQDYVAATLHTAFRNLEALNAKLVAHLEEKAFDGRDLHIRCDVQVTAPAITFDPNDDTIHLLTINEGRGNTGSNLFHEFMHFAGMVHVPPWDSKDSYEALVEDPVYSCQVAAFPEMIQGLGLDPSYVERAKDKCATVAY